MPPPVHTPEELGAILRAERRARGLTQERAAMLSGVSTRLWNETERGKRPQLGLDTAIRMLNTIGLDLYIWSRANHSSGRAE